MAPGVRKLMLTVHLTSSVGWVGLLVGYIVLDLRVATGGNPQAVRAAWIGMGLVTSSAIVPFAVTSLVTGLSIAAGTRWGLFRHWWVLISLLLTVFALLVLLSEAGVVARSASVAADLGTTPEHLLALPNTLPHSLGGLVVLLVIQTLNVYKPRGLTPYGWRKERGERGLGL
ncbi:MAG: DUF2269 domain-containing protein [Candidatus Limnocylindrales bacterium]